MIDDFISSVGEKRATAIAIRVQQLRGLRKTFAGRGGLIHFVRYFWSILEPGRDFVDGWPLWAMCDHLEAVSRGEITRLLINISPGSMKSLLCNVFWPAWHWAAFDDPSHRFISFSYGSHLTERDNGKLLDLLLSQRFIEIYGTKFVLKEKGKVKISNDKTGWKFASSVGGIGTGERGDVVILDDPHNIKDGESDTIRKSTVTWFREAMSNRLNDMTKSAIVVIMQRVHEYDVSGTIISEGLPYVHLCIPMEYEPDRHCHTSIGWSDPRKTPGECFWSDRFPPDSVEECRRQGAFAWASQYQQRPEIRGGGLLPRDHWIPWTPADGRFPRFDYVVASLDPAFTSKESNDPSGFTIWGAFRENGRPCAMLMFAWRKWLKMHGPETSRWSGETADDYRARCSPQWGLVETVADDCRRFKVDRLLIESKASGITVAQEFIRLFPDGTAVDLINPGALDKEARVIRVQAILENGQIYYPPRKFASMVIDECAMFPKGGLDDLTDSCTQAWWHMRNAGFLRRDDERFREELEKASIYKGQQSLYPSY